MIAGVVSTIIPVFNRADSLRTAVNSVLAQTYRPIEIIIVDDGSTDSTPQVAAEIAEQHSGEIHIIRQKNSGPGVARETGRQSATGEFIQYLDSDDLLLPEKFELQVGGLREHPECGISYGKLRHHQLPQDQAWKMTGTMINSIFPSFLMQRCWSTPSPLYTRKVSDAAGPWSELRQEEDWEYDCRIALQNVFLHFCDEFVAEIGAGDEQSLSAKWFQEAAYLKDRVRAHVLIFDHARKFGITPEMPEMAHFARELFHLSRLCGARGLAGEAEELFNLAREASGPRRNSIDFRIYELFAGIFGWSRLGKIACFADRFR